MTIPDASSDRDGVPPEPQTPDTLQCNRAILQRWRKRRTERKRARLVDARHRRVLAKWLRRTAKNALDRDPIRRRYDVLLHERAAAVRTDLLELAALVEIAADPDPASIASLRNLLANGDSPLYNAAVHVSELRATLYYARAGLMREPSLATRE